MSNILIGVQITKKLCSAGVKKKSPQGMTGLGC
jgi:hypothetical protein